MTVASAAIDPTEAATAPLPIRQFETVTCSRCGGSGQYSYCQRYGRTCFKCSGAKVIYTKRGHAAAMFYDALLSKRADQIVIGDSIRDIGITNGGEIAGNVWYKITEIRKDETLYNGQLRPDGLTLVGTSKTFGSCGFCVTADKMYRVAADADTKHAAKVKALDYQDTLTKSGTPRKSERRKQ